MEEGRQWRCENEKKIFTQRLGVIWLTRARTLLGTHTHGSQFIVFIAG